MPYKCINPSGAAPCISDSRFDPNLKDGTIDGKVIRTNGYVAFGKTVSFVDAASRKHFAPVDEETKKQDEKDYKWFVKELKAMGVDVPSDATLSELGATYDKFDPRMARAAISRVKKKPRVFGLKEGAKPVPEPDDEDEKVELRAWLTEHGVNFQPNTGLYKLRKYKAAKEEELAEPVPEPEDEDEDEDE